MRFIRWLQRIVQKPPFHYIVRKFDNEGKRVLLKLGNEPCETDLVNRLRIVWVQAILHFNGAAVKIWTTQVELAEQQKLPFGRLLVRIERAKESLPELEKLKAGKPISYIVALHEMGLLRECVKRLGNDAFDVIACIALWNGWHRFMSYAKLADRIAGRFYHWPTLGVIAARRARCVI